VIRKTAWKKEPQAVSSTWLSVREIVDRKANSKLVQ
jgi:hypothetical protein